MKPGRCSNCTQPASPPARPISQRSATYPLRRYTPRKGSNRWRTAPRCWNGRIRRQRGLCRVWSRLLAASRSARWVLATGRGRWSENPGSIRLFAHVAAEQSWEAGDQASSVALNGETDRIFNRDEASIDFGVLGHDIADPWRTKLMQLGGHEGLVNDLGGEPLVEMREVGQLRRELGSSACGRQGVVGTAPGLTVPGTAPTRPHAPPSKTHPHRQTSASPRAISRPRAA